MRLLTSIGDPPLITLHLTQKKPLKTQKTCSVYMYVQYYIIYRYCTLLCFLCKMYINVKLVLKNVFPLCGIFFRRIFAPDKTTNIL